MEYDRLNMRMKNIRDDLKDDTLDADDRGDLMKEKLSCRKRLNEVITILFPS